MGGHMLVRRPSPRHIRGIALRKIFLEASEVPLIVNRPLITAPNTSSYERHIRDVPLVELAGAGTGEVAEGLLGW